MTAAAKPTRREERRTQTVLEIKQLAMDQISAGGPDAVSLSGIVREMSMSPAALYRYFDSRDALLADLVVDAYNELADHLAALQRGSGPAEEHLDAVLRGSRAWALQHPNAYRLIFQTSIGSGEEFAAERTIPAASRSMAVIVNAISEATGQGETGPGVPVQDGAVWNTEVLDKWAERSGLAEFPAEVLTLALLTWTRLHGIISLELGGHLAATGLGADVLFDAEVHTIRTQAVNQRPATPTR